MNEGNIFHEFLFSHFLFNSKIFYSIQVRKNKTQQKLLLIQYPVCWHSFILFLLYMFTNIVMDPVKCIWGWHAQDRVGGWNFPLWICHYLCGFHPFVLFFFILSEREREMLLPTSVGSRRTKAQLSFSNDQQRAFWIRNISYVT